jgi:signal transduction histidine kinase
MIGFLTLYKASEQGLTPHIEAVNPERFLHEVARNHATHRPDVRLIIDNTAMPDIAFFDEHLVGLALDAALQNATRFATSRIELGCVQTGGNTVFTIRDDGPGLGTKEETVSTGLGMALCAAIAHAHQNDARHGSADLVTSSEGGALFSLRLP